MQTQLDWFDVDGEVRPTTLELTNSGGDKGRDRFKPVKCDPWKPLPRDVAGRRDNTEPRAQIKRPRLPTAPDEAMAAEGTAYALMPANSPCVCQDVVANGNAYKDPQKLSEVRSQGEWGRRRARPRRRVACSGRSTGTLTTIPRRSSPCATCAARACAKGPTGG